jgi:chaperonin GroES
MPVRRNLTHGLIGDRILVDVDKNITFQPMFDRILVEPIETKTKTEGGIIIPETARIEETMGKIVATGRGHFDEQGNYIDSECPFKVGNTVIFKEFTGTHITLGPQQKSYLIMWYRDVLGVLMKEPVSARTE